MKKDIQSSRLENDDAPELPVGTKYGCMTIIGGFEEYYKEITLPKIHKLQVQKGKLIRGIPDPDCSIDSVEGYERRIEQCKLTKKYLCQCKCGKKYYYTEDEFYSKRWRRCEGWGRTDKASNTIPSRSKEKCGLYISQAQKAMEQARKSNRRIYEEYYDLDLTGRVFESLIIIDCIDSEYEIPYGAGDRCRSSSYTYHVDKLYKCKCTICDKELNARGAQFDIFQPAFDASAPQGFCGKISCDCHKASSFQWIVSKVLFDNAVKYRVEYSFPDLLGKVYPLRFDFAVLNDDGSIQCLIECQGEQHYQPVEKYGGDTQFIRQQKNDELKREYAKRHNIKLIEIPYTKKHPDYVEEILKKNQVI